MRSEGVRYETLETLALRGARDKRERETERKRERERERARARERDRDAETETETKTDRQTNKQKETETDRQTVRERERTVRVLLYFFQTHFFFPKNLGTFPCGSFPSLAIISWLWWNFYRILSGATFPSEASDCHRALQAKTLSWSENVEKWQIVAFTGFVWLFE